MLTVWNTFRLIRLDLIWIWRAQIHGFFFGSNVSGVETEKENRWIWMVRQVRVYDVRVFVCVCCFVEKFAFNFVRRCRTGSATSLAQFARGCLRTRRVAIHLPRCPFLTVLASFSQFLNKICQLAAYYRINWAPAIWLAPYQRYKPTQKATETSDPEPWQHTSSLLPPVKNEQKEKKNEECEKKRKTMQIHWTTAILVWWSWFVR